MHPQQVPQAVTVLPGPSIIKSEENDIAVISVTSRIPDVWTDQQLVWFVKDEAVLPPQKLSDKSRFNVIITKLTDVTDVLVRPPDTQKYETLKNKLLAIYEESENRKIQKLIGEMDLGDQKPSQLPRRMRELAREKIPDDTLRILWQSHLPQVVRAVLAFTEVKDMENLATIADVMYIGNDIQLKFVFTTGIIS